MNVPCNPEEKNIKIAAKELTVIIPFFNEAGNMGPLLDETFSVLRRLDKSFEVLCIDDASTDNGLSVLNGLSRTYAELRVLRHRMNCGQSAACATGFRYARGSVIITMDGDQQNDPGDIPLMLEALENADVVCGVRRKREDDWVKRVSSKIANNFRNWITGDSISDAGCALRVFRKESIAELPVFNGMHRFLPTLLRLQGYRVKEISVNHRPRTRGVSKYGIKNRLLRGLIDCFAIRWWKKRCLPCNRVSEETGHGQ